MIDKNEAPEDHEAVKSDGFCYGCAAEKNIPLCMQFAKSPTCFAETRNDNQDVIFIRKSTAPATLLHPMGSLGEEV